MGSTQNITVPMFIVIKEYVCHYYSVSDWCVYCSFWITVEIYDREEWDISEYRWNLLDDKFIVGFSALSFDILYYFH